MTPDEIKKRCQASLHAVGEFFPGAFVVIAVLAPDGEDDIGRSKSTVLCVGNPKDGDEAYVCSSVQKIMTLHGMHSGRRDG